MSNVIDALAGLKAAFLTITPPTGVSLGRRVWAWPADRANVDYGQFPFILCGQVLNEAGVWNPMSQGTGYHRWPAEVLICLNNWSSRDEVSAADEAAAQTWLLAAAEVVFDNRGLGGAALDLGNDQGLLTTQIGEMGWLTGRAFFGVYVRLWVHQVHSLPSV